MKKFLIGAAIIAFLFWIADAMYYKWDVPIYINSEEAVTSFTATEGRTILVDEGEGLAPFEIKGVDMGLGIPGHFATDYAIDKETYLRWFGLIQEMGANTVRIYTIQSVDFYDAFYEYNSENETPLYLLHGVWVDDYAQNSHMDAYDEEFVGALIEDSRAVVDIIHGRSKKGIRDDLTSDIFTYNKDISDWVLGYLIGVEWEHTTVIFTNDMQKDRNSYQGEYIYTSEEASPFETMLAQIGDAMISYETDKYREQRLVAFANWPTTDPFLYEAESLMANRAKHATVDVEHILTTDAFISGQFASYHVYSYFPDYLNLYDEWKTESWANKFLLSDGTYNTYAAYLYMLVEHHSMPVVISEFGIPSSRGRAQSDTSKLRSQGYISEKEQAAALKSCYEDIKATGCAGSAIFSWQDEWFKRTWNILPNVDLTTIAYWSDYQTNEQFFGILTFDPGEEKSVCYVDGDVSEWSDEDVVLDDNDTIVSVKYDEKFVYLRVHKDGYSLGAETLYIPFDITPKTGSYYADGEGVKFERQADFLLVLEGENSSRLLVQERYDVFHAMNGEAYYNVNPYTAAPDKDSPVFREIYLALRLGQQATEGEVETAAHGEVFETGKLTYGNANPDSPDFNSLADFIVNGEDIEIRLPWQLLNFGNPSEMEIHDDYYENYGVEFIGIKEIYIGIGSETNKSERIKMNAVALEGWGNNPTYHERLKEAYYVMQELWTE